MSDPQPAPTIVDGVDIDAVYAAVVGCPGVAALGGGSVAASLTTYLPGRRIPGIRINPDSVELEVVAAWQASVAAIAAQIKAATAGLLAGRRVDITISDVDLPAEAPPLSQSAPSPSPSLSAAERPAPLRQPDLSAAASTPLTAQPESEL